MKRYIKADSQLDKKFNEVSNIQNMDDLFWFLDDIVEYAGILEKYISKLDAIDKELPIPEEFNAEESMIDISKLCNSITRYYMDVDNLLDAAISAEEEASSYDHRFDEPNY